MHNKRVHAVSLIQLEAVANACLEAGRAPFIARGHVRHPGAKRAGQFQKGVMLKLLVRVPLRQRNLRELQLEKNLYQDREEPKHWHLHFQGSELKIGMREGQVNVYHVNLAEETDGLVPVLEEFLRDHRPRLPGAATSPYLFLTMHGRAFTAQTLHKELADTVFMRTGQRFYPHLIRTTLTTEYLERAHDSDAFGTLAIMLGDKPETVRKHYYAAGPGRSAPRGKLLSARRCAPASPASTRPAGRGWVVTA
jgi:hypothetical protein